MNQRKTKPRYERSERLNITLPPKLHEQLPIVVRKFGFKGPADYFQARLRKDAGLDIAA